MLFAALLFFFGVIETKPLPVLAEVRIHEKGPYRFLVDTGAETSVVEPSLAAELGITPQFRVELVTQHGTQLVAGARTDGVSAGGVRLGAIELLFHDVEPVRRADPSVRGVLGWNALEGRTFTISAAEQRLELDASRPAGEVVPFERVEGRIALRARMGRETLRLLLDSGASHVVLFRTPAAMAKVRPVAANFTTIDGARRVTPTCWTADMLFGERVRVGTLPAAIVERRGSRVDGLLPVSVFRRIYVDPSRNEIVLVR